MNKLNKVLLALAVVAPSISLAQASCPSGGFYAGVAVGYAQGKIKVKANPDEFPQAAEATKLLQTLGKIYKGAIPSAAQTQADENFKKAATALNSKIDSEKGLKDINIALDDSNVVIKLGKLQLSIPKNTQVSKVVFPLIIGDALSAIVQNHNIKISDPEKIDIGTISTEIIGALKNDMTELNELVAQRIKEAIINRSAQLIKVSDEGIALLYAENAKTAPGLIVDGTEAAFKSPIADYLTAATEYDKFAAAHQQQRLVQYIYALGDSGLKTDDLQSDEAVNKAATRITGIELKEIGFNDNKKSAHRGGFVGEANVGCLTRVSDMMFGGELSVGFNTQKVKTAKNGIYTKNPFYVGLNAQVGYLVTPQFLISVIVGAQVNKYKTDVSALTNQESIAKVNKMVEAANETRATIIEQQKLTGDNLTQFNKDYPELTVVPTSADTKAKSNKTRVAPVVGLGVTYFFSQDIFATLRGMYQFSTKAYNKNGIEVKHQAYKFTLGVGFNLN